MHVSHAAKQAAVATARLRERMREDHASGLSARSICRTAADDFERIVIDIWEAALAAIPAAERAAARDGMALVAQGGFGRRQMAPWSDVDLAILHHEEATALVSSVARRLVQDLYDAGVEVGQSVRTPAEAAALAATDASVASALVDCRLLGGDGAILADLSARLAALFRSDPAGMARRFVAERALEMARFGGSATLLEPNVKRSAGAIRDVQMVHWLARVLHDEASTEDLAATGLLPVTDVRGLDEAEEFLLRVRVDLHLAAGKASDDLTRAEQVRIAEAWGHRGGEGMLAVERFMREVFRHMRHVSAVLEALLPEDGGIGDDADAADAPIDRGCRFGPRRVRALAGESSRVAADPAAVVRMVGTAARLRLPIDRATWRAVRAAAPSYPATADARTTTEFLALFEHPAALGEAVRRLHDIGLLERVIPSFRHARHLVQFNNYHKFTVDEHCILAMEKGAAFADDPGWLGETWRHLSRRRPLLLALLVHDLGKGFPEDHSILGARMARQIGDGLRLPTDEREIVEFLVLEHLSMAHLAFRRDAGDDSLVVPFARRVGSPEVLRMLSLLTAADVSAVGPGTWTRWKADLLADVHFRTLAHLDGESITAAADRRREALRLALAGFAADDPVRGLVDALPVSALGTMDVDRLLADLSRIARLPPDGVLATAEWQAASATVAITVATRCEGSKAFHRATGALTAERLAILAADIHPLGEGTLARFLVADGDFVGEPPAERIGEITAALRGSMRADDPPAFPRRWNPFAPRVAAAAPRVVVDNESSARTTIVEVFADDSVGLLHGIARTLAAEGFAVRSARVATHLDQVVDAFHVTDAGGAKVVDPARIAAMRAALEHVVTPPKGPA